MKRLWYGGAATVVLAGAAYGWAGDALAPLLPAEEPVRVLFVGDLMLDRNVARAATTVGARGLFATSTLELFADADLRVGNLEGTITTNASIAQRNNKILRFTFDPALARDVLQLLRFDAVSLANNHALDFGEFGYDDTVAALSALGIKTFGQPYNDTGKRSTMLEVRGKQLCFVGYHSLFVPDRTNVVADVQSLRPRCWRVVVVAHWGEEYETLSNDAQQSQAHAFIDAGADLVIGAHPHVVQEVEVYQGKAIFYSLGNFVFDQNFSWETMHGLGVQVDLYEEKTRFTLIPLTIANQHASVTVGADRERTLEQAGSVAQFILP